jgi:hypothetical protein
MKKSRPGVNALEIDRTIVRFPDPAVEVVDERFRSLVVSMSSWNGCGPVAAGCREENVRVPLEQPHLWV